MAAKFMRVKRIVLSILTIAILVSQLSGCAMVKKDELSEMIKSGETIVCEVVIPDWSEIKADMGYEHNWVQLDQLRTYTNNGFRNNFDKLFNINIVANNGINSKQGCIYVVNIDGKEVHSGNTSMRDAFRNKTFVDYYTNGEIKSEITKLADNLYLDVESSTSSARLAVINAYFDVVRESNEDTTYEANRSLTREQFYALVYRSSHGVEEIVISDDVKAALGEVNQYTPFVNQLIDNGYLKITNGSLNTDNINSAITKYEALYIVVETFFKDQLNKVDTSSGTAFGIKNAGDLAVEIGAIVGGNVKPEEMWTPSEAWQLNVLGYMLKNPDKGMDQTLFRHMKVAEKLSLMGGLSGSLTDPITKNEAIQLMMNVFNAENKLYGYLTTGEYAEMPKNDIAPILPGEEITTDNVGDINLGGIVIDQVSELTLDQLSEEQLKIFEDTWSEFNKLENVADYIKLSGEKENISRKVSTNDLPINGVNLYIEWREINHPVTNEVTTPDSNTNTGTKNPYNVPVPDETKNPTGPDESNKQEEQAQKDAQQSASSKFTYPPNSTTEGLPAFYINGGCYIDKSTGKILDQQGNCYGYAKEYQNGHTLTDEEHEAAVKANEENAKNIYNGDGSGSDTSNWNH